MVAEDAVVDLGELAERTALGRCRSQAANGGLRHPRAAAQPHTAGGLVPLLPDGAAAGQAGLEHGPKGRG